MPSSDATVVVGGGISGLALSLSLVRSGARVTLLEAFTAPGGTAQTVERDGFLLETGPNSVLDRDGAVAALADSVGRQLQPASDGAGRRGVVLGGRLRDVPSTPLSLVTSDVLPLLSKLRLLLEPFTARAPVGVDESLADFARRHLGRTATATLVDALQTGIWAGDIESLSAASAFPRLWALEKAHRSLVLGALRARRAGTPGTGPARLGSFEGGLGALSAGMAMALGDALRVGEKVTSLTRRAEGWTLRTEKGTAYEAAKVVLALPCVDASLLVRPFDAGLAEGLLGFPSVPVAVVHLGYRPALEEEPQGFGFLVPALEKRDILGTVYASSAFPFRVRGDGTLLTVLLGGAHRPELMALDDAALVQTARRELSVLLGIERAPTLTHVFRWLRAIPQYNVGHAERVAAVLSQAARWPGLWLSGNTFGGAGVADCIRNAEVLAGRILGA
jgi:protoporphyrinogen/coproporphyrinogen III oxidase